GDFRSKPRWSANRKIDVVLRLLRGESLEEVSREVGVEAHRLQAWRDDFLESGKAAAACFYRSAPQRGWPTVLSGSKSACSLHGTEEMDECSNSSGTVKPGGQRRATKPGAIVSKLGA